MDLTNSKAKPVFSKRGWRRKKEPSPHPILLAPHLCVVFIEHDDNLGHVVELRDGTKVSQSSLPLCILGFLSNTKRRQCLPRVSGDGQRDKKTKESLQREKKA